MSRPAGLSISCLWERVGRAWWEYREKEIDKLYTTGLTAGNCSRRPKWSEGQTCILFECVFSSNNGRGTAPQKPLDGYYPISERVLPRRERERKRKKERESSSARLVAQSGYDCRAGPLDDRYWLVEYRITRPAKANSFRILFDSGPVVCCCATALRIYYIYTRTSLPVPWRPTPKPQPIYAKVQI